VFGQLAIPERASGRLVDHAALVGTTGRWLDAPLPGRGGDQHCPGFGPGLAHRQPCGAHTRAGAGHLNRNRKRRINIGLVGRRLLDAQARPVGIEFLRGKHRQRGEHTLPHFRAVDDDRHAAVAQDPYPRVGRERRIAARRRGPRATGEAGGHGETGGDGHTGLEKFTAGFSRSGGHCCLLQFAR
jgi:hypothetical protein